MRKFFRRARQTFCALLAFVDCNKYGLLSGITVSLLVLTTTGASSLQAESQVMGRAQGISAWQGGRENVELALSRFEQPLLAEFWIQGVFSAEPKGEDLLIAELWDNTGKCLHLVHSKQRQALLLKSDETVLQRYPVYHWDEHEWSQQMSRSRQLQKNVGWHHVAFHLHEDQVRLMVDGFPAIVTDTDKPAITGKDSVIWEKLKLVGNQDLVFAELNVTSGVLYDRKQLRERFKMLFLREPSLQRNLLSASFMSKPPVLDGQVNEIEWGDAARICGWVQVREGWLSEGVNQGYVGYDNEYLYIALVWNSTQTIGNDSGVDIYIGPPFVSGEEPKQLYRLTGGLNGSKSQSREQPSPDKDWQAVWDWKVTSTGNRHVAEMRARFKDLNLPYPATRDEWSINVIHNASDICWFRARWPQVPETMTLIFDKQLPAVRMVNWEVLDDEIEATIEIYAASGEAQLILETELYGEQDVTPIVQRRHPVTVNSKDRVEIDIEIPLRDSVSGRKVESGHAVLSVKAGNTPVYYQTVRYSVPKP